MGKRVIVLIVVLGLAAVAAFLAAQPLLERATHTAVATLPGREISGDVAIREVAVESVGLSSPRSATWHGIRAVVERQQHGRPTGERYEIRIERVRVAVTGPGSIEIEAHELHVAPAADTLGPRAATFEGRYARLPVALDPFDPLPGLREAAREMLDLLRSGNAPKAFEIDGLARIRLRGSETEVRIGVADAGSGRVLVADRGDLEQISRLFHEGLTEAVIDLVSRNALRAPRALAITEQAQTTAQRAARADPRVPEDAYRHVLWSYLLTREFGEDFAEALTDAHEDARARRVMPDRGSDLRNNAVGRDYARQNVPEGEVLARLLADRRVVRVR